MGVLANHVPSIEQLRPGLVEVIEESAGSKQFFRMYAIERLQYTRKSHCSSRPGLKGVFKGNPCVLTNRSLLVSGGFAIVQPGSQLSINAVEGYPLDDFNPDVS